MNKLIETQIEQAAEILRLAQTPEWEAQALRGLIAFGERLLQVVQNQQSQIEETREALTGTDEVVKGLVANPDAVRELFEEVRRNESGLCPHGAKRIDCVHCDREADIERDRRREMGR